MNSVHWNTRSARAIAPLALCVALAAIPTMAGACDMKAVDNELTRLVQADRPAGVPGQPAHDPSPNEDQTAKPSEARQPSK